MAAILTRDKWKLVRVCGGAGIVGFLVYQLVWYMTQSKVPTTDILVDCETNFTTQQGAVFIPEDTVLNRLRLLELICLYERYMTNIQTICHRKERLGGLGHGGWDVCVDVANTLTVPCLVYSFGINYDFSFDDSVATKYGCEVHSFDASMGLEDHRHSAHVHFHPIAISNRTGVDNLGRQTKTWEDTQKGLFHQECTIDILKMDIDTSEWTVLKHIFQTASSVAIRQLVVEFHDFQMINGEKTFGHSSKKQYIKQLQVLKMLHEAGFRIVYTEVNVACKFRSWYGPEWSSCHKLCMVKQPVTTKRGFLTGWLK